MGHGCHVDCICRVFLVNCGDAFQRPVFHARTSEMLGRGPLKPNSMVSRGPRYHSSPSPPPPQSSMLSLCSFSLASLIRSLCVDTHGGVSFLVIFSDTIVTMADLPLRVASSSNGISTALEGRWTYLTTEPRIKTFLTELCFQHVSTLSTATFFSIGTGCKNGSFLGWEICSCEQGETRAN